MGDLFLAPNVTVTTDGNVPASACKFQVPAFAGTLYPLCNLYTSTAASTAVTGASGAEQTYDVNYTLPANTLKAGSRLKIRWGINVSGVAANDNVVVKLYIGGTGGTALQSNAGTDPEAGDMMTGECEVICRTAGASGTFVSFGTMTNVPGDTDVPPILGTYVASTTINTTTTQQIILSCDWDGSTSASNTSRLDFLTVDISG